MAHDVLRWLAFAALGWWGLDELVRGVNPFRRILGAVALLIFYLRRERPDPSCGRTGEITKCDHTGR
jgi:hypothetical protein